MASGFFALFDDIATLLDDIAALSKVAARKTSGVIGDDLALNAQQVSGVNADRELPVVWAVFKGSLLNKAILVPAALLISAYAPHLIVPMLMIGGVYLCYEGAEKIIHALAGDSPTSEHSPDSLEHPSLSTEEITELEKTKIRGAIRTDFILSAEIIVITLGTVAAQNLITRSIVLAVIALLMTIGVYGLVAAIVKMDDLGLHLIQPGKNPVSRSFGRMLLAFAPILMKFLSYAGTIAMFLVGGGIIVHNLGFMHHLTEQANAISASFGSLLLEGVMGLLAGLATAAVVYVVNLLRKKK